MNTKRLSVSLALAVVFALTAGLGLTAGAGLPAPDAGPLGTDFTYQGRLTDASGHPIGGPCDFSFGLWDDLTTGSQVGTTVYVPGVSLRDGLFTVSLDFGAAFDGTALWLEVAVQCAGDPGYTTLTPRQGLTAAPNALYAMRAQYADNAPTGPTGPSGPEGPTGATGPQGRRAAACGPAVRPVQPGRRDAWEPRVRPVQPGRKGMWGPRVRPVRPVQPGRAAQLGRREL